MSYIESSEEQVKELSPRFRLLYFVVVISAVVFVMRLWYLQIFMGTELRISSDQNRIKRQKLVAPRGMILDREGRVLVDNLPGFDVQITPQYARELEKTADEVGRILSIDPKQIVKDVRVGRRKDGAFKPVVIKRNLNRDEVARIERIRHAHPGLTVVTPMKRTYMLNEDGAQLFGYVGEIQ
ncbi:MAG: penicillin-binding protein 2, partial [Bdellovibrionales bacterium]|nr:penicillin-binding protein 2 [Bdellovibrionales bacterium]